MEKRFNLTEINEVAKEILQNVDSKILLFIGEMGVGKTTLIREVVKALGYKDDVSSPTFSIVNEYDIDDGLVYHFDFYRIKNETEAFDIGFEDYIYSGNWCFIEWPEKIIKLLPEEVNHIYLDSVDGDNRKITLKL